MKTETGVQHTLDNGWHTLPPDDVIARFAGDERSGLTSAEAEQRLKHY